MAVSESSDYFTDTSAVQIRSQLSAYGVFNASGGKEIPGWMMVATLVDF
eukprot:COSAG01_NODE_21345_length_906_cov_1.049566_2_plen_48_part_01